MMIITAAGGGVLSTPLLSFMAYCMLNQSAEQIFERTYKRFGKLIGERSMEET